MSLGFITMFSVFLVRFEPTIDPNTAYRHMKLSDDCRKVTMRAENLNPPDHPDRFFFWRQVLCKEPLAGSPYYWEVEWMGQKVNPYTQALNATLPLIYALLIIMLPMIVSGIIVMFVIVFWRGMLRYLVDGLLLISSHSLWSGSHLIEKF